MAFRATLEFPSNLCVGWLSCYCHVQPSLDDHIRGIHQFSFSALMSVTWPLAFWSLYHILNMQNWHATTSFGWIQSPLAFLAYVRIVSTLCLIIIHYLNLIWVCKVCCECIVSWFNVFVHLFFRIKLAVSCFICIPADNLWALTI